MIRLSFSSSEKWVSDCPCLIRLSWKSGIDQKKALFDRLLVFSNVRRGCSCVSFWAWWRMLSFPFSPFFHKIREACLLLFLTLEGSCCHQGRCRQPWEPSWTLRPPWHDLHVSVHLEPWWWNLDHLGISLDFLWEPLLSWGFITEFFFTSIWYRLWVNTSAWGLILSSCSCFHQHISIPFQHPYNDKDFNFTHR